MVPRAASEVFTRPVGIYSVGSAEKRLHLHPWLEGCRINLTAAARGWSERRQSEKGPGDWLACFSAPGSEVGGVAREP